MTTSDKVYPPNGIPSPDPVLLSSAFRIEQSIMATTIAWAQSRSKDPSTKVGACIHDAETGGLFLGYNGFPSGIPDREEWWTEREEQVGKFTKYDLVVHAEINAVRKAMLAGVDLTKCILVCTHLPCPKCMRDVICANGIKQVYYAVEEYASMTPRAKWIVKELASLSSIHLARI